MDQIKKRENWIDIAKGILIILVIFLHSFPLGAAFEEPLGKILRWTAIPGFLMLNGYLLKSIDSWTEFGPFFKKNFVRLIVPYISFLILLFLYNICKLFLSNQLNYDDVILLIKNSLYGGHSLPPPAGILWFFTCLFFTRIIFVIIQLISKKPFIRIFLTMLLFFLAHILSWKNQDFFLPLGIEICPLFILYLAFGNYLKQLGEEYQKNVLTFALTTSIFIAICLYIDIFNFDIEFWSHYYKDFALDLAVPIIFAGGSLKMAQLISKIPHKYTAILCLIGIYSIPLLALHECVNEVFSVKYEYGRILYTVIGVFIPLVIGLIIEKNKITKRLFLGT